MTVKIFQKYVRWSINMVWCMWKMLFGVIIILITNHVSKLLIMIMIVMTDVFQFSANKMFIMFILRFVIILLTSQNAKVFLYLNNLKRMMVYIGIPLGKPGFSFCLFDYTKESNSLSIGIIVCYNYHNLYRASSSLDSKLGNPLEP